MKLRPALPTIATSAALAAALLLPATSAAAETARTTGTAPGTSAPSTDPTTQITGLAALQTDHGYVLRATASGDVDHVTFVLEQTLPAGGGPGPKINITVSQPSADGSWQTTGPLHVPHGFYWLSAYAYSADGTPSYETGLGGNPIQLTLTPVFHDTAFSPGPLSYDAPTETVSGRFTTYDPDSGDTGAPWTGPLAVQASAGDTQDPSNVATTQAIAADGTWHISFQPRATDTGDEPVSVQALLPGFPCPGCAEESITGPSTTVPVIRDLPTRIVLDHTSATLTIGTKTTVSGVLQYQNASGWHPVPNTWVFLGGNDTISSAAQAETDTNGRFTLTAAVPATTTTWAVNPISTIAPYLQLSPADYTVTAVPARLLPQLSGASIDANNNLTFHHIPSTPTGAPGGVVQLQQSADGRTGWTTIAILPAATATLTVHVNNPHGYWRLYAPTAPGYTQAVSNTIHTFRHQTRITGVPSTTTIHKGTWVHFTGTLAQQGHGPWTACTNQTVQLLFRPNGSTHTTLIGTARTNAQGHFALWAKPTATGTWTLAYTTTSVWNTNAATTATIHVS
jgi:hypothetical protein